MVVARDAAVTVWSTLMCGRRTRVPTTRLDGLVPAAVLDRDPRRPDRVDLAVGRGKVPQHGAAGTAEEDVGQQFALGRRPPVVDVEADRPRAVRLIVVVDPAITTSTPARSTPSAWPWSTRHETAKSQLP